MNADTLHRSTASAPPVDPPGPAEPATEPVPNPPVEPSGPGTMPPDPFEPFPDDPSTPPAPEPQPAPGGLRPPFEMP